MAILYRAQIASPIGALTCICDNTSIIRLLFASDNEDEAHDRLVRAYGTLQVLAANDVARLACRELEAYFFSGLKQFSVRPSFISGTPFSRKVWREITSVPYGVTASYQSIAVRCGAGGSRAVGNAVGRNPVPIIVPCHRIIRKNGDLGGFGGGSQAKQFLLHLEGVSIQSG